MKKCLITLMGILITAGSFAQVKVNEGPELNNETTNKMNRMIEGENGLFYAYRVRTKGKGTSYLIEKFDESKLKTLFSKEVEIPTERSHVLDVRFSAGKVFVFYVSYDKEKDLATLNYKTVSSTGAVSAKETVLLSTKSDHYEFVDYSIQENQSKTKMAVKNVHKASKDDAYKSDFVLFDGTQEKIVWTKTIDKMLKKGFNWSGVMSALGLGIFGGGNNNDENTGFLGYILNDNDDIYYAYNDKLKKESRKEDTRYNAAVEILKSTSQTPVTVKLDMNPEYLINDVMFAVNKDNSVILCGYYKDIIERPGRDLIDVGVFNYRINTTSATVEGKAIKTFDAKFLTLLESNQKKARNLHYKVDYVMAEGDNFYMIGEQYRLLIKSNNSSYGMGMGTGFGAAGGMRGMNSSSSTYEYEYQDVIVAKINTKGEFDWIVNSPLRNGITMGGAHVFKQYFAVLSSKGVYLFYNEHPKNVERLAKPDYEPSDLKTCTGIHGSNMVYSKITPDGKVQHAVAYKNESYCFAPIQERDPNFYPPEDSDIYVKAEGDNVIVYTEDKGKGRFLQLGLQ